MESCYATLIEKYSEIEIQSLTLNPLLIFSLGKSSSLGKIALYLILLSLFLGSEIMTYKSMLAVVV
jgi:hypothetical protein